MKQYFDYTLCLLKNKTLQIQQNTYLYNRLSFPSARQHANPGMRTGCNPSSPEMDTYLNPEIRGHLLRLDECPTGNLK